MRWNRARLDDAVTAVVAAVLPARCAGCGCAAEPLCSVCAAGLRGPPRLAVPGGLDAWIAPFSYEGVAREMVARVKYRNQRSAIPFLAAAMGAEFAARLAADAHDLLTWVPASARRRHASGFDHGELLARAVARRLDLPVARLLTRGPGAPQTGRTRADRSPGPPLHAVAGRARGRNVVLVDDVVTTGATLAAAALALRRGGAVRVVAVTAAATPPRGR